MNALPNQLQGTKGKPVTSTITAVAHAPISADVDLRDFDFIPLQIQRLKQSKAWLIFKRKPELTFYSWGLWMRVWHEIPAGSIEDDDDVLADAANCDPRRWNRIKAEVLRGWVSFNGRLYHPYICELAKEKWHERLVYQWDKECDRIRKANKQREKENLPPLPLPAKPSRNSEFATAERSPTSAGIPSENALKGEEEGEGEGEGDITSLRSVGQLALLPAETPVKTRRQKKAKSDWPEGFALTEDMAAYSRKHLPADRPQAIFEAFKNHHQARGNQFADWTAAFRTWVTKGVQYRGGKR